MSSNRCFGKTTLDISISSSQSLFNVGDEADYAILRRIPRLRIIGVITEPSPASSQIALDRVRALRNPTILELEVWTDPKHIESRIWIVGSCENQEVGDRKSTRLNSSHGYISYAVFCLKKKIKTKYVLLPTTRQ